MGRVADALNRAQNTGIDRSAERGDLIQFFAPGQPAIAAPWTIGTSDAWLACAGSARPNQESVRTVPPHPSAATRTVPRSGSERSAKLVTAGEVKSLVGEEYNQLATTLHQMQIERNAKVAMLTSAARGEGKTLTAANLALTLSESHGRRVLLVDADLRRPTMHDVFGVPQSPGLSDSLSGDPPLPVASISRQLVLLTAGDTDHDPMRILTSDRMRALLDEARHHFDWVIVDTAPVGLLPDAKLVSSMADVTLLVVSAGKTAYDMMQRAVAALGPTSAAGVVLNSSGEGRFRP